MATFKVQVEGLTSLAIDGSSAPTQDELTQFLTDGAKEVINSLPGHLLSLCASSQSFTSGSASTLNTGKILNVFRSDGDISQPCRKISAKQKGVVTDPDEMSYATITDPVFFIDNNSLDVLPAGGSCTYSEVQYPAVVYGDSAIAVFPDEAEHLVALYGAVKSLQNVLGSKSSNSDVTTALTAINTELDKIVTDVHVPVAPAINEISYTDVTAPSKADISGNAPTYTKPVFTGTGSFYLTEMEAGTIGDAASDIDAEHWFSIAGQLIEDNEDVELVRTHLEKISTFVRAYQVDIQNELNEFNKENAIYQANIQAEMAKHDSDLQVAIANGNKNMEKLASDNSSKLQKYSNELQSYQQQVSKFVQSAQGYANEVQSRMQVDTAQYGWYEKQQAKLQSDYDKGLQALS